MVRSIASNSGIKEKEYTTYSQSQQTWERNQRRLASYSNKMFCYYSSWTISTTKRYIGATLFVDHYSDFTYTHLMKNMNAETTVEAKYFFERQLHSHQVSTKYYHADNGLFDTQIFKQSISTSKETLSFCGLNAHHQNGKEENRIKDVTTGARTQLLHAAL